jgi:hypothetical protein
MLFTTKGNVMIAERCACEPTAHAVVCSSSYGLGYEGLNLAANTTLTHEYVTIRV